MAKPQQEEEVTDADFAAAQDVPDEEVSDDDFAQAAQASETAPIQQVPRAPLPVVGAGETFINRAVNALPAGKPITDIGATGQLEAARALGRILPDTLARHLPGVLPEPSAKLTPEAVAQLLAMGEAEEKPQEMGTLDTYRGIRDSRIARTELGSEQNPWTGRAGTVAGIGLSALSPLPAFKAGASLGSKVLTGALNGSAYGALGGLTDGRSDLTKGDVVGALGDAAIGGGVGAALGGLLPLAVAGARKFYTGVIEPTAAAKYLRAKGVPLTTGQMDPKSAIAQIEEASTSIGGVGPAIQAQRDMARKGWQNAVLNEALPPGLPPPDPTLPVAERLSSMYDGFVPAYAPAKGAMITPSTSQGVPLIPPAPAPPVGSAPLGVPSTALPRAPNGRWMPGARGNPTPAPSSTPGIFDRAVDDPTVLATGEDRGLIRGYLANELTIAAQNMANGKVRSDVVLQMRHNIRQKINEALASQSFTQSKLLENAERELTDVLENSLPPSAFAALKAADAQYARYKPVESAVALAGDQTAGFSPAHLSQAIRTGTEKGSYARGAGGELRELASKGREVLDTRSPPTGARLLTMSGLQWLGGPMSYAANLGPVQRFLLGETAAQKAFGGVDAALSSAINRVPQEAAAGGALDALGMGSGTADRSTTPAGQRFYSQVSTNPQAFGQYGSALQEAAKEGPEALSMQDFLMSSDPAYLEARRKAAQGDGGAMAGPAE